MTFANKLKSLRTLADESQKHLAGILGISDVMISQYENGKKMPGRETMKKIANHYDTTLSNLLGEEGANHQSDEIIILNRGAKKMTPEKQRQLLDMAKLMFKEEFTEDDD